MTTPRVDTIVRGGKVVTASDIIETAVAIKGDKIAAIGPENLLPPADRVIDAGGRFVLPGLIDCHLHVGAEYDDWKTAAQAAAYTGLTTLLPFVVYDEGDHHIVIGRVERVVFGDADGPLLRFRGAYGRIA